MMLAGDRSGTSGVTSPTETDATALSPFAAAAGSAFARSSMSGSCFTSPRPDNGYNRVRLLQAHEVNSNPGANPDPKAKCDPAGSTSAPAQHADHSEFVMACKGACSHRMLHTPPAADPLS